ncbi:hypothetical protein [Myxococcus fulvus]|uniref:hypothetical protein n=1 Tax=Myxococcus TaxID=32 RepID=UPI0020BDB131|nr:hypothetical protein [Myxococcus fulvus]MCK8503489.1 hypothetical protein [Myxococcus fulvus]
MRAEDLLTRTPSAETVARETQKLPEPSDEARESLRQVLEASARPAVTTPWPALLTEARGKMDSRYAGPVTSHRGGVTGPALVLAKRAFRLVFQPFINEALRKQVEFNESILDALATIHDVQREHARTQATWRQDVERRLARIEEAARGSGTQAQSASSQSSAREVAQDVPSFTSPQGSDAMDSSRPPEPIDKGTGAATPRPSGGTSRRRRSGKR